MVSKADGFASRAAAMTGNRMQAVVSAFVVLVDRSWPNREGVCRIAQAAGPELAGVDACRALLDALDAIYDEFPTVMFWWKNEHSTFLGFCPRFAAASGVGPLDLLGRNDADLAVAWNRQAALYMRDDREVLISRVPRFDILERQDRGGTTVWLRTSKVPYESDAGSGTVGGFDTISAKQATELARAQR